MGGMMNLIRGIQLGAQDGPLVVMTLDVRTVKTVTVVSG